MILSAEYRDRELLEQAIGELRASGVGADDIELFSSRPVELKPGLLDRPGHMSLSSVIGGVAVGLASLSFVYWAQHDYPLVTGGMPIFSGWPVFVVIFETTMAGAVGGIMVSFLHQGRFTGDGELPAPPEAVEAEAVILRVRVPDEDGEAAESRLRGSGGVDVVRL